MCSFALAQVSVSPATLENGTVGVEYSQTFSAQGGSGSYAWGCDGSTLPEGLFFDAETATLYGTPTWETTRLLTISVSDDGGSTWTPFSYDLNIYSPPPPPPLTISGSLTGCVLGGGYSQALFASGGAGGYFWQVAAGSLPEGLALDPYTGMISGTPLASGTSSFTVTVVDGAWNSVSADYQITIYDSLAISGSLPNGMANVAYSQTLGVEGGSGSYSWSLSGQPCGLEVDANGAISGTPSTPGTHYVTVAVTDLQSGLSGQAVYEIIIGQAPIVVSNVSATAGLTDAVIYLTMTMPYGGDSFCADIYMGGVYYGSGSPDGNGSVVVPISGLQPNTSYSFEIQASGNITGFGSCSVWDGAGGFQTEPDSVLEFSAATYQANENDGSVTITINRSGSCAAAVSVDYSGDGEGTVTFDPWETSKTFTVPITNDGVFTGDATFTLVLANPQGGAAIGSQSVAVLTIIETDPQPPPPEIPPPPADPTPTVSMWDVRVDAVSESTATISWVASADVPSGSWWFDPGAWCWQGSWSSTSVVPDNNTVNYSGEGGSGSAVGSYDSGSGRVVATITGLTPGYSYGFTAVSSYGDVSASAGGSFFVGTPSITLANVAASSIGYDNATVSWEVSSPSGWFNYTLFCGTDSASLSAVQSGSDATSAALTGLQPNQTYYYYVLVETYDSNLNYYSASSDLQSFATLPPIHISSAPTVSEVDGDSVQVSWTVDNTTGLSLHHVVHYSWTDGENFGTGEAVLDTDGSSGLVSVMVEGLVAGRSYSFWVESGISDQSFVATSGNNDGNSYGFTTEAAPSIISSGPTLEFHPDDPTQVDVSWDVSPVNPANHVHVVWWENGPTYAVEDGNGHVMVTLTGLVADTTYRVTIQSAGWGCETVQDNGGAGFPLTTPPPPPDTVQFSAPNYMVGEGSGTAEAMITVTRTGSNSGTVTVDYGTSDNSASGTLSFEPWETSKEFTVPITYDPSYTGNREVGLALSNPQNGAILGSPYNATLTITDSESPPGQDTVQFEAASYTVNENGVYATIAVTRAGNSGGALTVNYSASDGSTTGMLSFESWENRKTFDFYVYPDGISAGDRTVGFTLSDPQGGGIGTQNSTTLTIIDADTPRLMIDSPISITYETSSDYQYNTVTVTWHVTQTGPGGALNHVVDWGTGSVAGADDGNGTATVQFTVLAGTVYHATVDSYNTALGLSVTDNNGGNYHTIAGPALIAIDDARADSVGCSNATIKWRLSGCVSISSLVQTNVVYSDESGTHTVPAMCDSNPGHMMAQLTGLVPDHDYTCTVWADTGYSSDSYGAVASEQVVFRTPAIPPPTGVFRFDADTYSVTACSTAFLCVMRDNASGEGQLDVAWSCTDAEGGTPASGTLSFGTGETVKVIAYQTPGNWTDIKTVTFSLTSATGGTIGSPNTAPLTIYPASPNYVSLGGVSMTDDGIVRINLSSSGDSPTVGVDYSWSLDWFPSGTWSVGLGENIFSCPLTWGAVNNGDVATLTLFGNPSVSLGQNTATFTVAANPLTVSGASISGPDDRGYTTISWQVSPASPGTHTHTIFDSNNSIIASGAGITEDSNGNVTATLRLGVGETKMIWVQSAGSGWITGYGVAANDNGGSYYQITGPALRFYTRATVEDVTTSGANLRWTLGRNSDADSTRCVVSLNGVPLLDETRVCGDYDLPLNLSPDTAYTVTVAADDDNGEPVQQAVSTCGFSTPPYLRVDNLRHVNCTDNGATITWYLNNNTGADATSTVYCWPHGEEANLRVESAVTPAGSTPVSVTFANLTPATLYDYLVQVNTSAASIQAPTEAPGYRQFYTGEILPLAISNLQVTGIAPDSAQVLWTVEHGYGFPLTNTVFYWQVPDGTFNWIDVVGESSVRLTGLQPGTSYNVAVVAVCGDRFAYAPVDVDGIPFTTLPVWVRIVSPPSISNLTADSITITWGVENTSSLPLQNTVLYNWTDADGQQHPASALAGFDAATGMATAMISGLQSDRAYDFSVRSTVGDSADADRNGFYAVAGQSLPYLFRTLSTQASISIFGVMANSISDTQAEIAWGVVKTNPQELAHHYVIATTNFPPFDLQSAVITEGWEDSDGNVLVTLSGLTPNTAYRYYVQSIIDYADGHSATDLNGGNFHSFTTDVDSGQGPQFPAGQLRISITEPFADPVGDTTAVISWDCFQAASANSPSHYVVFSVDAEPTPANSFIVSGVASPLDIGSESVVDALLGLQQGRLHYYFAQSVLDMGEGGHSTFPTNGLYNWFVTATPDTPPGEPPPVNPPSPSQPPVGSFFYLATGLVYVDDTSNPGTRTFYVGRYGGTNTSASVGWRIPETGASGTVTFDIGQTLASFDATVPDNLEYPSDPESDYVGTFSVEVGLSGSNSVEVRLTPLGVTISPSAETLAASYPDGASVTFSATVNCSGQGDVSNNANLYWNFASGENSWTSFDKNPTVVVMYPFSAVLCAQYGPRKGGAGLSLPTAEMVTPKDDPTKKPKTTTGDGQNQFTFNNGSLTITFKAKVTPAGMANQIANRCFFEVPELDNVKADGVTDGKVRATLEDDNLKATVTYSSLPNNNSGFGSKTVKLSMDGNTPETTYPLASGTFEVFFELEAKDHPGGGTPNWYYYWGQTPAKAGAGMFYYGGDGISYVDPNNWRAYLRDGVLKRDYDLRDTNGVRHMYRRGIETYAFTTRHEYTHASQLSSLWDNKPRIPGLDRDNDFLPDTKEPQLGYDPRRPDSLRRPDIFGWSAWDPKVWNDAEHYALSNQEWPTDDQLRQYDRLDWSKDGRQWNVAADWRQ